MAENEVLLPDAPAADIKKDAANKEGETKKEEDTKEAHAADDLADKVAEAKVE